MAWTDYTCGTGTGACTGSVTLSNVWAEWSGECATNATNTIWTGWAATSNATTSQVINYVYEEPTPEHRAAWQRQAEAKEAARAKAEILLLSHLNEEQRAQYQRDKFFVVRGSKGGVYKIAPGNYLRRLEGEREVESLCCHPSYDYPEGDHLVTKKLWLEADEEEFRRVANKHPIAA